MNAEQGPEGLDIGDIQRPTKALGGLEIGLERFIDAVPAMRTSIARNGDLKC